ncbi:MAG: type IV pilus assembly protein PilW [Comamonadaceae bacterium]|nr:MAG: type IV pilus assembly protein PilW [Comamonadaceae bacterium]
MSTRPVTKNRSRAKLQRGFSVVELMVGLTIGLFIVLAAISSLVFTKATSSVVDDGARLQQKADAIFRNIGYHISQAGAIDLIPADELGKVMFSGNYLGFSNPAGNFFNIFGTEGANNAPDTLGISYEKTLDPNSPADRTQTVSRDCLGNQPTGLQADVDNLFSLDTSTNDLMCLGAAANTPAQSIANGVEDFQVLYGVQTGVPGLENYQYFTASAVTNWANIQAVRVCIQVIGESNGNPRLSTLRLTGCRGQTLTNDNHLRRIFTRTFSLRNSLS